MFVNPMSTIALIPCFNEEKHIASVVTHTKKYVDTVIVVDDGSNDHTTTAAKNADYVLRHIINLGKGADMKTGMQKAIELNAEIVIIIDGDGQHDSKDIPRFLEAIKECDIVVGQREFNNNMPLVFRLGNWGLHYLFSHLFHSTVVDTQSGFRAIRASILPKIQWSSDGYAVETEMLAHAGRNHLRLTEIPIKTVYHDTVKGTTIIDGIKIGVNMLKWRLGW